MKCYEVHGIKSFVYDALSGGLDAINPQVWGPGPVGGAGLELLQTHPSDADAGGGSPFGGSLGQGER